MSKLIGNSITDQGTKLKEKEEQIIDIKNIIQQKAQIKVLLKKPAELNTVNYTKIINQLKSSYIIAELCRTFNIVKSNYNYR